MDAELVGAPRAGPSRARQPRTRRSSLRRAQSLGTAPGPVTWRWRSCVAARTAGSRSTIVTGTVSQTPCKWIKKAVRRVSGLRCEARRGSASRRLSVRSSKPARDAGTRGRGGSDEDGLAYNRTCWSATGRPRTRGPSSGRQFSRPYRATATRTRRHRQRIEARRRRQPPVGRRPRPCWSRRPTWPSLPDSRGAAEHAPLRRRAGRARAPCRPRPTAPPRETGSGSSRCRYEGPRSASAASRA